MKTALVIEDNAVIRGIVVEILTELGITPIERQTAEEGVGYCASDRPDVVILDWDLPSMGALDFLRGAGSLQVEDRSPILLCATENDPKQFSLAKAAGAEFNILKPFDKPLLAKKLAEIGILEGLQDVKADKPSDADQQKSA